MTASFFSGMPSSQPMRLNRPNPVRFSAWEVEKINPWELSYELGLLRNDYGNRGLVMRMMANPEAPKIAKILKASPLRGEKLAGFLAGYPEDLDTFIRDLLQNNERFQTQLNLWTVLSK